MRGIEGYGETLLLLHMSEKQRMMSRLSIVWIPGLLGGKIDDCVDR